MTSGTAIAAGNGLDAGRQHLGWRSEMMTVALATWTLVGVFLDGLAHSNVDQIDTFFTPQHAVFYSGFLAMAVWVAWSVGRNLRAGRRGLHAVPVGYEMAIAGLITFGLGTLGDFLWHAGFGIEQAGERLASPAHLVLFVGGMLVITSPFRAAWAQAGDDQSPSLKDFLPGLLSLTLATTATSFFFLNVWGFLSADYLGAAQLQRLLAPVAVNAEAVRSVTATAQARVFGSILITNLLLLGPVLLMPRRWRIPFGSVTILFTVVSVGMSGLVGFKYAESILIALAAGVGADVLMVLLRPSPNRPGAYRAFATLVPAVLWTLYFVVTNMRWGLAVSPELWVGGVFFTAMSGFGLSLMMVPASDPSFRDPAPTPFRRDLRGQRS